MAWTILKQPLVYTPAYNDVMFVVHDSNYTANGYKYIFDIKVYTPYNTAYEIFTMTLHPKSFVSSLGTVGHCMININKILQDYITFNYDPANNFSNVNEPELVVYDISFYYSATGVTKTVIPGSSTITNRIAWNGCVDFESSVDLSTYISKFKPSTSTLGSYLNIKNYNRNISLNDYATLTFFRNYPYTAYDAPYKYVVTTNTGKVFTKTLPTGTTYLNHIGIGPHNINTTTWTTVSPGGSTITETDNSYTVQMQNSSGTPVMKTVTYNLICSKYDKYKVDFQTDDGGFSYVNFYNKHFKSIENKKETYSSILPYSYSTTDIGYNVYSNTTNRIITLNTDWLNDYEIAEVENLLSSPKLFMVDNNGITTSMLIQSVTTDIKKTNQDKLVSYTIDFIYANKRNTIR